MVNLTKCEEIEVRRPVDGGSRRHSHRNWGVRFGRRREEMKGREPTTLHDLESLTDRAVEVMESHGSRSENNFLMVMDLLRLQYNLVSLFYNFLLFIVKSVFLTVCPSYTFVILKAIERAGCLIKSIN